MNSRQRQMAAARGAVVGAGFVRARGINLSLSTKLGYLGILVVMLGFGVIGALAFTAAQSWG